ncbi:inositol monophosphatase [Sphingomonas glaciei]|uniref:Inositol monophosphatase n=2 Tax=Sphingomonas glaciei TaxID=2938948 RepID=A0ABY5N193_9SPHN|nr:inositol monophosphatase [Sphingomonas glaciei]
MRRAASEVLLPRFRTLASGDAEEKSAGEVVTIADRECEAMLEQGLAAILPEASIVGEEAVHARPGLLDRLGDPLCWIVDPLDGTGYYAEGQEPFGIMIALASGGRTVGGWILDPLADRLCWAAAGAGCWIDGQPVRCERGAEVPPVIGLSPLLQRRPERLQAVRSRLEGHYRIVDIPRCAAAHYPAMLSGGPDLTLYERTLAWDHAPGALMIEEAGGRCARLDGSGYRVDDAKVGLLVATDQALWDGAAARLTDLPN